MKTKLFSILVLSSTLSLPTFATNHTSQPGVETKAQVVKKIDLNTATASMLSNSIKGIGKKRAEAIVSYREAHGAFHEVAELSAVKGLGKTFVNKHLDELKNLFTVKNG